MVGALFALNVSEKVLTERASGKFEYKSSAAIVPRALQYLIASSVNTHTVNARTQAMNQARTPLAEYKIMETTRNVTRAAAMASTLANIRTRMKPCA